ncbi:flippase-like domain-containing protein [Nakamurella sp. GG22]
MATSMRKGFGVLATALAVGVGVVAVWDQLPSLPAILGVLSAADPLWLTLAAVATVVAIVAFSLIQRRLVTDLGGRLSRSRSVELTLTSGAISMALPAGSALGAGYTYRRLRGTGLSSDEAGVSMVGSAGLLTGTLVALYLALTGPTLFQELTDLIGRHATGLLVLLIVALVALAVLRVRRPDAGYGAIRHGAVRHEATPHGAIRHASTPDESAGTDSAANHRAPAGRIDASSDTARPRAASPIRRALSTVVEFARATRATAHSVPLATWRSGAALAVVKWAADFAVLAGAVLAVGGGVDLIAMASVYVGVQILRQVPLTPGGVGIVEAALLAGLIAAGASAAPAAAAVVVYRGLTFWLALLAGAVTGVAFRSPVRSELAGATS